ncbi:MAG TPA: YidC/Oxa1 family membrane protein insertase, partial [Steroidobacteraceae bacterium]
MVLWHYWLGAIQQVLGFFAHDLHLGTGLGIILLTVAVRSSFLPITWTGALQADMRRRKLKRLEPALEALKKRFDTDRQRYAQEMMDLYRREGITVV